MTEQVQNQDVMKRTPVTTLKSLEKSVEIIGSETTANDSGGSFWWLLSRESSFVIKTTNLVADQEILAKIEVAPTPCGGKTELLIVYPGGSARAESGGVTRSIKMSIVPKDNVVLVAVQSLSSPCVVASDVRVFFGGLDIKIQIQE